MAEDSSLHSDTRVFNRQGTTLEVTNTAVAFPSLELKSVPGKAPLANNISIHLHEFLKNQGIETHFIKRAGRQEQSVAPTEHLRLDVRVCNVASGELVEVFGMDKHYRFPEPLVEFFARPDVDGKPRRISESHLLAFDMIDPDDMEIVNEVALRVNDLLTGVFFGIGVQLIDIRLEFGELYLNEDDEEPVIVLISELSPDTMTLWDIKEEKHLDSSLAFTSEDGLVGYKEIARRFDLDSARATLERQTE